MVVRPVAFLCSNPCISCLGTVHAIWQILLALEQEGRPHTMDDYRSSGPLVGKVGFKLNSGGTRWGLVSGARSLTGIV